MICWPIAWAIKFLWWGLGLIGSSLVCYWPNTCWSSTVGGCVVGGGVAGCHKYSQSAPLIPEDLKVDQKRVDTKLMAGEPRMVGAAGRPDVQMSSDVNHRFEALFPQEGEELRIRVFHLGPGNQRIYNSVDAELYEIDGDLRRQVFVRYNGKGQIDEYFFRRFFDANSDNHADDMVFITQDGDMNPSRIDRDSRYYVLRSVDDVFGDDYEAFHSFQQPSLEQHYSGLLTKVSLYDNGTRPHRAVTRRRDRRENREVKIFGTPEAVRKLTKDKEECCGVGNWCGGRLSFCLPKASGKHCRLESWPKRAQNLKKFTSDATTYLGRTRDWIVHQWNSCVGNETSLSTDTDEQWTCPKCKRENPDVADTCEKAGCKGTKKEAEGEDPDPQTADARKDKEKEQEAESSEKSWWGEQTTAIKALIIGGGVTFLAVLIGILVCCCCMGNEESPQYPRRHRGHRRRYRR